MIRKYHNHKLQTNPWHHEVEPHNNHETPGRQTKQATGSLFPIEMITKLEWTQSEAEQMKKVNKQCLLDTPRKVRVGEKTWQVIVQTSRP